MAITDEKKEKNERVVNNRNCTEFGAQQLQQLLQLLVDVGTSADDLLQAIPLSTQTSPSRELPRSRGSVDIPRPSPIKITDPRQNETSEETLRKDDVKNPTRELKRIVRSLLEEMNDGRERAKQEPATEMAFQPLTKNIRNFPSARTVHVMFAFLSIFDIETKRQLFTTEVVIQARWAEPSLKRNEVAHGTLWRDKCPSAMNIWEPRLRLKNLEEVKRGRDDRWYVVNWPPNQDYAEIIYRRKVRGAFYQKMELQHFPVDVQAISVQVNTDLDNSEISLKEDDQNCSIIFCEAFRNDQEWKMFEHVQIQEAGSCYNDSKKSSLSSAKSVKYPTSTISAVLHVGRKQGYFFWNVYLILTFITMLSFCGFAIPNDLPNFRIGTTLTLLLTSVTFKLTISGHLPTISYLTFLDKYSFMTISFLSFLTIVFAFLAFLLDPALEHYCALADRLSFTVLFFSVVVFHVYYYRVVNRVKKTISTEMDQLDSLYQLKVSKNLAYKNGQVLTMKNLLSSRTSLADDSTPTSKPRERSRSRVEMDYLKVETDLNFVARSKVGTKGGNGKRNTKDLRQTSVDGGSSC